MKFRKRAVALCIENNRLLCVLLQDPESGEKYWLPPGGGIEEGEAPAEAAKREMFEETMLHVKVDLASHFVETYPFFWAGVLYSTENHYFLVSRDEKLAAHPVGVIANQSEGRAVPFIREPYILEEKWLDIEGALKCLQNMPTAREGGAIGRALIKMLNRKNDRPD